MRLDAFLAAVAALGRIDFGAAPTHRRTKRGTRVCGPEYEHNPAGTKLWRKAQAGKLGIRS